MLYVRNLTSDVSEETLKEKFGEYGKVERVKKIKDYGFIHYEERDDALKAMAALNGEKIGSLEVDISLAKPPSENKKKEQRKRDQERRMMRAHYFGFDDYWIPPVRGHPSNRAGLRRQPYAGKLTHIFNKMKCGVLALTLCNNIPCIDLTLP